MLADLFNNVINQAINNIDYNSITEIRLRLNSPITIAVCGKYSYLCTYGTTNKIADAIYCNQAIIEHVINVVSNNCLYTINDQIINGYIAYRGGIRIGVAGDFVYNNNKIVTIKDINALNIRVPHSAANCSLNTYNYVTNQSRVYNTLVMSPAGAGKTTYIRDLARQLLLHNPFLNLLVVDERCEIAGLCDSQANIPTCDILSNCNKQYAFDKGIKSLRPDVIITDEISGEDLGYIANAISSGVSVVATIHAHSINDIRVKPQLNNIVNNRMFDRYILIDFDNGNPGKIVSVYNENLECIGVC